MLKRKKFLIGGLIIVLAMSYLGYMGLKGAATYYYTVSELLAQGSSIYGQNLRVNGQVAPGSVVQESQGTVLRFTIVDMEGGDSLPVVFRGVVPDTFKENAEVVVEGHLAPDGVFLANTILAKCPSKYVPEE